MIDINEQIKCVKREIAMRQRVYTRLVDQGRMKMDNANHEMGEGADTAKLIKAKSKEDFITIKIGE